MYVANWEPISLLNVDIKIASKKITLRLETILYQVNHSIITLLPYVKSVKIMKEPLLQNLSRGQHKMVWQNGIQIFQPKFGSLKANSYPTNYVKFSRNAILTDLGDNPIQLQTIFTNAQTHRASLRLSCKRYL